MANPHQQRLDTAETSTSSNGLKRKRGAGGSTSSLSSRGVANLTPEQLERKRANDREAQRAIRERTKNQIESLNREIQELKSQQPYLDLQLAIRQKEAIKAENEELRRRIFAFITAVQPFLSADAPPQGLEELAAAAEHNAVHHSVQDAASTPGAMAASSPTSQASLSKQPAVRTWTESSDPTSRNIHPDLAGPYSHYDERLGVEFLLDNNRPKLVNGLGSNNHGSVEAYSARPVNVQSTCNLDTILLSFRIDQFRLFQGGVPSGTASGPPYPNFNALLDQNTSIPSHPISKVVTDVVCTFSELSKLPEQVAVLYIMFLILRWLVDPTRENYELLPDWITPRPSQLFTPHPHWLDYLPFPRLRDACVQQQPPVVFDNFFVPYTATLSLNWPYEAADVLVPRPPAAIGSPGSSADEPEYSINPVFETHLRKLENWSLGPAFVEAFPEWKRLVKISDP